MRTIIAGPRDCMVPREKIAEAVEQSGFKVTEVFCGCSTGVDEAGAEWAAFNNVPVMHFPAAWDTHGSRAGPMRNARMAKEAEALIVIQHAGRETRGTADVIRRAKKKGVPVYVMEVR